MIFKHFLLATILFWTLALELRAEGYTIEDLKVLASENNYNEFILHAYDIRPGLRDEWWKENLCLMAKKYIEERITKKDFTAHTYQTIDDFAGLAATRQDEFVSKRREDYLRLYLNNCFETNTDKMECYRKLNFFWESTKNSINRPEMALELSALLDRFKIQHDKWKFFHAITTGQAAEFYCAREEIQEIALGQMVQEFSKTTDLNLFFERIEKIVSPKCLDKIYPTLSTLLTSDEVLKSEMSYRLLEKKKALNENQSAAYLIGYLMMGPIVGDTFNQSWNMLESLGKNYNKRMAVFSELKNYDPLPDGLINSANVKKRDLLLDLMNRNFPEFLDYYATTCLDYLEGKRIFPNGNPTRYCRLFFTLSENKEWPSAGHKLRYQNLPKFN